MARQKVRIRFRKSGDLRLISHHDLLRCFERMLRRASLPFHSTSGFNPKPRAVFALPLPLGIIGCREVVELELDAEVPHDEIHERLARHAPAGLEILSVRPIDWKTTAHVRSARYQLAVPEERCAELRERIASLLAMAECWIERQRPEYRRLDVRPYLRDLIPSSGVLSMDLGVTPNGTARPEEVVHLLGLADLLESGAVLERTDLELEDETVGHVFNVPPEPETLKTCPT
jgi:radical SAM-linked protein